MNNRMKVYYYINDLMVSQKDKDKLFKYLVNTGRIDIFVIDNKL
jgi:hypothetical protein